MVHVLKLRENIQMQEGLPTLNPSSVSVEDPLILIPPTPPNAQVFKS